MKQIKLSFCLLVFLSCAQDPGEQDNHAMQDKSNSSAASFNLVAPVADGCRVMVDSCPQLNKKLKTWFVDEVPESATSLDRCMDRMPAHSHGCDTPINDRVLVEYWKGGVLLDSSDSTKDACLLTLRSCPGQGNIYDHVLNRRVVDWAQGIQKDESKCLQRASEWVVHCALKEANQITTEVLRDGKIVKSLSLPVAETFADPMKPPTNVKVEWLRSSP